ncbi:MAG: helix-turn-helix domain-containing protein [Candidatus Nanoarchaeia archaeon]|nr:helix-turn-helix domain-containing protein [Candidatus Nanoarchaeia archaeon]
MANFIFPQEIEVNYMIPSLRKELAAAMKDLGLTQREIAKKLRVTEQAISQYFNEKRAIHVTFNDKVKSRIKELAPTITEETFQKEMQNLLKLSMEELVTCKVCHDKTQTHSSCKVCFEK